MPGKVGGRVAEWTYVDKPPAVDRVLIFINNRESSLKNTYLIIVVYKKGQKIFRDRDSNKKLKRYKLIEKNNIREFE